MPESEKSQDLAPASEKRLESNAASQSQSVVDELAWLLPAERYAYDTFLQNRKLPGSRYAPISTGTAMALFQLFLNGRSLREIYDLNQHFSFGQVVHAAVDGRWADHRKVYLDTLFANQTLRAQQVAAEGAEFTGDIMAAAHKLHGAAVRKFLQSGDVADLGAMGIGSLAQYQKVAELHQKLTGQDKVQTQKVSGTVKHKHEHSVRMIPTAPPPAITPQTTLNFLTEWGAEELQKQEGSEDE